MVERVSSSNLTMAAGFHATSFLDSEIKLIINIYIFFIVRFFYFSSSWSDISSFYLTSLLNKFSH